MDDEGFVGRQGLDHDFVADDLAVLDAKRATAGLAIGAGGQSQNGLFRESQVSVLFAGDSEAFRREILRINLRDFDDHQPAAQSGGGDESAHLRDADLQRGLAQAQRLPGETQQRSHFARQTLKWNSSKRCVTSLAQDVKVLNLIHLSGSLIPSVGRFFHKALQYERHDWPFDVCDPRSESCGRA